MKLAVSNIAWSKEEEADVAALLKELGVTYIEVAPTKQWQDPTLATDEELQNYKDFWQSYGIEIVAFQSMLFNRPDLKIFEDESLRNETREYLNKFISIAPKLGAGVMVFGSPKNRQKGDLDDIKAEEVAVDFFTEIGNAASGSSTKFCIEPNAPQYACDFITNANQGINFVKKVNTQGFGLHLDIACMTLASDDITKSISSAGELIDHFHISSPMLESVVDRPDVHHREAAVALRNIGYSKFVSIEMKPSPDETLERVKEAVLFAQQVYSS